MSDVSGLAIRPVGQSDRPHLVAFYQRLSAESRYARFLGFTRGLSDSLAGSMCSLDHISDQGFVATIRRSQPDGREVIVGHVCLESTDGKSAEIAIAVSDEEQGRGIGRRLFEAAVHWAAQRGYERLVATAFSDNYRVLRLLSSAPNGARLTPALGGVVEVVIPLGDLSVSARRSSAGGLCDHPPSWPLRGGRNAQSRIAHRT